MAAGGERATLAAGATHVANFGTYDRFGGRGGKITVRAVMGSTGVGTDMRMTLLIGSEHVAREMPLTVERAAGAGPEILNAIAVEGWGAPGDPINLSFRNLNAAARDVQYVWQIDQN